MELELKDVAFAYDRTRKDIFSEIAFTVKKGEVFCLLGPNGCGKSTLLNCISGLYRVTSGRISVDGKSIYDLTKKQLAGYIGYVPQFHHATYDYTVREFVIFGRSPHISLFGRPTRKDFAIADAAIETLNITHLRDKSYMKMSGGERQLALFARVIAQQPAVILLDEPTASLDFGNQLKIVNLTKRLSEMGFSIVMTTHHPDHALIAADCVCVMHGGKIEAVGPPEEVITEAVLTKTYDTPVVVEYVERIRRPVCLACEG